MTIFAYLFCAACVAATFIGAYASSKRQKAEAEIARQADAANQPHLYLVQNEKVRK